MGHAIPQAQLNSSTLEAEIQCGSLPKSGNQQTELFLVQKFLSGGCAWKRKRCIAVG
ncbi:hypothetical protein D3C78_1662520 [compost metagenome]